MPDQDALVWLGGRTVAVVPVPVPEPRPGWVPVDVAYAGICGTDLHIAAGRINACRRLTSVGIDPGARWRPPVALGAQVQRGTVIMTVVQRW
jgi:NADPH:quinone reductase-like Zn-dependent oxidoreductase